MSFPELGVTVVIIVIIAAMVYAHRDRLQVRRVATGTPTYVGRHRKPPRSIRRLWRVP